MSPEEASELKMFSVIIECYESKKYQESINLIDSSMAIMKGDDQQRMTLLKAMCLTDLGEFERAIDILEKAMKVNPSQYGLACHYAKCLYYKGDISACILRCRSILISKPEGADLTEIEKQKEKAEKFLAHLKRGLDFYKTKKFREAIKEFTEALKIDPLNKILNATAFYNRGMALQETRYYKSAVEDFDEVIKLDPSYSKKFIHEQLALCLYKIRKYQKCKEACEEALKVRKLKKIEKLHKKATIKVIRTGGSKTETPISTSDEYQGFWKLGPRGIWRQGNGEGHDYWGGRKNSTVEENDKKPSVDDTKEITVSESHNEKNKDEKILINLEIVKELIEVEKLTAAFFRGAIDLELYEKLKSDSKVEKSEIDNKKKPSDENSLLIDFESPVDENKADSNSLFLSAQSLEIPKPGLFSRAVSFLYGILNK